MIEQPSFATFYTSIHGREPFPWQDRLARLLASGAPWPSEIGIETGLGKTACLDIAVWWLASQAHLQPNDRIAPTRIWWLVNRRLLVDATTDHAVDLAQRLRDATGDDPLAAVSERLRALSVDPAADPLQVVRLRGGIAAGRPVDPSQPAIVLSTLPMYGSRLLFRGYGSSRSMRPIDAALAGTDALVLVDEAHLARHLMELFEPLAACDRPDRPVLPPARRRPSVVSLTATGSADLEARFALDDFDLSHSVVRQRLDAAKPVRLVEPPPRADVSKHLASTVADLLEGRGESASCVVFVNTPSTARRTATVLLMELAPDQVDLVLLTGRQRERESMAARERILDAHHGAPAGRAPAPRDRHLVVVATQTLEVGADVDFELCVTEACGVRALTQRLGRLNRLGRFEHAQGAYVHVEPAARGLAEPSWPVYGSEPITVLQRLKAGLVDGFIDLSPARVASALGAPADDSGRAPAIMPALLWEWVKTTCPPEGEAPVEPFFSGLADPVRRISVCWRAHVPAAPDEAGPAASPRDLPRPDRIWPRVRDVEVIELPLAEARDGFEHLDTVARLGSDRVTVEYVDVSGLKPGDTVILPVDAGLVDEHGWNPEAVEVVADASLQGAGLPIDVTAISRLVEDPPKDALRALLDNEDPDEEPALIDALLQGLRERTPGAASQAEWEQILSSIDAGAGVIVPPGEVARLAVRRDAPEVRVDELDELSAASDLSAATGLVAHGAGVEARARAVAESIGLDGSVGATLACSARFHDVGKADPRFQRWLDPRSRSAELLAKSQQPSQRWLAARIASGWPRGGRHEELSARLVLSWLAQQPPEALDGVDQDLLVHLVVSHHGHARPLLAPVPDGTSQPIVAMLDDREVEVDADLAIADWEQPDRFARLNRRYGHWGLALLEAVVRQSDHAVSAGAWAGSTEEVV